MVDRVVGRSARPQLQRHAASIHITEGSNMIRHVLTLPPKVKTLAEQNADFTAEGAPPPGKVGMSIPDTGHESVQAVSPAPISRNVEEIARTIQGLNRQIENRQSTLARIRREKESRMGDFDNQIKRESDELARLEGQMVDMKKQMI